MRFKKSFRLLIATLLLLTGSLISGCGCGSSNSDTETTNTDVSSTDTPPVDTSRFTSVKVKISGDGNSFFNYAYILTDTETGKQYLYTYYEGGYNGGAAMVEIGTTEPSIDTNNE